MSTHNLTLISLSSAGCHLPGRQVPMARHIREDASAALWPTVVGDVVAVGALELACNLHPEARWWIVHQHEAKNLIAATLVRLLALRKSARKPLMGAT
jgi:hypothetical protein